MKNNDLVEFVEDSEEFYKKISKNVKILRQKYKYTQLDFSANIGFTSFPSARDRSATGFYNYCLSSQSYVDVFVCDSYRHIVTGKQIGRAHV